MDAQEARKLAVETIATVKLGDTPEPVADTTLVGLEAGGYFVVDNGEEVNGLSRDQAIEIIVENLTA